MILVITSLATAQSCASALQEAMNESVEVASTLHGAVERLQAQPCSAVILDQLLLDSDPEQGETLYKHLGTAVPVHLNFAVAGVNRVIREVRSAMHRRNRELLVARREAERALSHELKETVTALLLSCELALQVPDLPPVAEAKMRAADALAKTMREKLGVQQA